VIVPLSDIAKFPFLRFNSAKKTLSTNNNNNRL